MCLLSLPAPETPGNQILVLNFLRVLLPIAGEMRLITGNYPERDLPDSRIRLISVRDDPPSEHLKRRLSRRAAKYVAAQLKMSYHLARIASAVDVVIFFIGGSGLLLPMLTAKLRGKKTILVTAASGAAVSRKIYERSLGGVGGLFVGAIVSALERMNYRLCDKIVVYSPVLIQEFGLERHGHKICIAHRHFVDLDRFRVQKRLNERDNLVGYVGRLSQEKGILNLLEAVPKVAETRDGTAFLIAGNGQLRAKVEKCAAQLGNKVRFVGWIPHDELPQHLNNLRLLVLPSYTEGLPNIMLEAMACGTPVLATPVGAVPDIIKDGETGFIMEDNSAECIADNIARALGHPRLQEIADKARALVEKEFNFEKAVERYRRIVSGDC